MKKKIKTYGVRGLMEWMCNIPVGKTHLSVEFSGGVLTQYGNTPAKFTTDDLLKQAIIENSKPFKGGKITLLSCVESQEEETRRVEGTTKSVSDDQPTSADQSVSDDQPTSADQSVSDDQPTSADQSVSDDQPTSADQSVSEVEVSSLDDAKEYLNKNHGVAVRNLRSRQAIIDAAKECGVSFKGL